MIKDKILIRKLNTLKKIEPRSEWRTSSREILVAQVKAQVGERQQSARSSFSIILPLLSRGQVFRAPRKEDFIWMRKLAMVAVRPVGAIVLIISLALGSGVLAVNAAFNSLPGDALYGVKLTTEKIQLGFSFNDKDKAAMEIEFAGRRIDEVQKVAASSSSNKAERIRIPLQEYKNEMKSINNRLENLNKSGDVIEVVKLANLVDDKIAGYTTTLEANRNTASSEIKNTMKEALAVSQKTNDSAVKIILEKNNQIDGLAKDEAVKIITEKINQAEIKIGQLQAKLDESNTKDTAGAEDLAKTISDAKALLDSGDLTSAFQKVQESNELTRTAEEGMASETTDGTATDANTETEGKVEGGAIENTNTSSNVSGSLLYEEKK